MRYDLLPSSNRIKPTLGLPVNGFGVRSPTLSLKDQLPFLTSQADHLESGMSAYADVRQMTLRRNLMQSSKSR